MRIDRLALPNYKNLVDFEVDFDETSTRQVVVGRNGVGKSNLLEALTRIFRDLDLEEEPAFAFEIEYLCNSHYVKIRSAPVSTEEGSIAPCRYKREYWIAPQSEDTNTSDDNSRAYKQISESEFSRRNRPITNQPNPDRILPLYVFGYYSGTISRFTKIFERHEERYFREQVAGEEAPLRPLFQAKPHHSQFALLAFYATRDEAAQKFLETEFRIFGFDSALFALREPYWKTTATQNRSGTRDPRFWHAGGKVAPFLNQLFEQSYAPMIGRERVRISIGQEKTKERRFCFLPDEIALRALANGLDNKEFFARLESLVFSDLVDADGGDVRMTCEYGFV
jgi:energy-coupling factor transporter ATP-binding protein EcfA2